MGYFIWVGFVSHGTKSVGICVLVDLGVHFLSFWALESLGVRPLCRRLYPSV